MSLLLALATQVVFAISAVSTSDVPWPPFPDPSGIGCNLPRNAVPYPPFPPNPPPTPPPPPCTGRCPNVLFIVADDARPQLGAYGTSGGGGLNYVHLFVSSSQSVQIDRTRTLSRTHVWPSSPLRRVTAPPASGSMATVDTHPTTQTHHHNLTRRTPIRSKFHLPNLSPHTDLHLQGTSSCTRHTWTNLPRPPHSSTEPTPSTPSARRPATRSCQVERRIARKCGEWQVLPPTSKRPAPLPLRTTTQPPVFDSIVLRCRPYQSMRKNNDRLLWH